jgi:uncharacterized protein
VIYFAQRSLIYHPNKAAPLPIEGVEIVKVKTPDGLSLEGWYISGGNPTGRTILYFHGNAGHYGDRIGKAMEYVSRGYNVLLAGYRGYGGNEGSPSEGGLYEDARAYRDYLLKEKNTLPSDLIFYGESLGGGVAVQMASEYSDAHALILETPFSSLYDVAKKDYFFLPVDVMLKDRFMSREKIAKINCPVLILHGRVDQVIPYQYAELLFNSAVEPKSFVEFPEGTHHNLYQLGAAQKIIDFLGRIDEQHE